jgi:PBP1b-binding outer membrane lipoprotein LpoB
MRAVSSLVAVVVLALALGACGESDEEKAMNTVCDAKDNIASQVDELQSLTPATVTTDAVTQNLAAIRDDLGNIADAQSDLSDDRRSEVEAATSEFTASIRQVAGDVGTSLSASDAKDQAVTALQDLGTSYQETLAPLDCE